MNPFFKEDFEDKPLTKVFYDCEIMDIVYDKQYKESGYGEDDSYKINYHSIKNMEKFTFFNLDRESNDEPFFCFDSMGYKNYGFSVVRIAEYIDEKIKSLTNNTVKKIALKMQKDTDEPIPSTLTVPKKIKILDELNIKGWLQEKNYTVFQIEKLLSDLFDRTDKTIREGFSNQNHKTTAENYLANLKTIRAKRE